MQKRITLADVAGLASVSTATASRALRDDPRISEATRRLVRQAADQLGYVPNLAARALRRRSTDVIGLLLPTVTDPMHAQVVTAIEQEGQGTGFTVFIATTEGDPDREAEAMQLFADAPGLIVVSSVLRPRDALEAARSEHVVLVLPNHVSLAGYQQDPPVGTIRADDPAGVVAEVGHLIDQGVQRPAFVRGPLHAADVTRRMAAEGTIAESHLRHPLIVYPSLGIGFDVPEAFLSRIQRDRPDALICYDDFTALRLMHALRQRGISIPDDIAVCGFDDVPFAAMATPPLTTVAQPTERMGRLAMRMILETLDTGTMPASVVEPVRFIPRASTERAVA